LSAIPKKQEILYLSSQSHLPFISISLPCHQRKKKSIIPGIPYMGHLMEVAGIVEANGGDETAVAVALVHDAIEDQGSGAREQIRQHLGPAVLEMVEACTESETFPRPPWQERKLTYLSLIERASLPVMLVIVADKLQNSRALLRRLKVEGAQGWGHPGREEKLWYFHNLVDAMRRRLKQLEAETNSPVLLSLHVLLNEYAEVIAALAHY
jgi:(p)ppGpp synthase/HD superfamily hydrolase